MEKEVGLRELTTVLLAGKAEEARQRAYAALAKGNTESETLDVIVDTISIVSNLNELDQFDQAKLIAVENAVNASLQVLEEWLAKTEGKFNLKVTVGPVGLKTGSLSSIGLSASLRAVGFRSTSLGKTQTALDLLRNSEELGANLVIPLLSSDDDQQLRNFTEAYDRGGFKNKFQILPVANDTRVQPSAGIMVAHNSEEAISKATEWALKNSKHSA